MKIRKNTYVGDKIYSLVEKFCKNFLVSNFTDLSNEFSTLYFSGSGFDLIFDWKNNSVYVYCLNENLQKHVTELLEDSEIKTILRDLKLYLEWLSHGK